MNIKELRSVENLFVVVADIKSFDCLVAESVEIVLERFYRLPEKVNWGSSLAAWKEFTGYDSVICTKIVNRDIEDTAASQSETSADAGVVPRFRVTCTRTHSVPSKKHLFSSTEAAAKFGGGINDFLGWAVDLENFDLEILLNIVDNHVVIGISLTKESLYRRNIVHFGPTTLRSTLAYSLSVAADIKEGEIVNFDVVIYRNIGIRTRGVHWGH